MKINLNYRRLIELYVEENNLDDIFVFKFIKSIGIEKCEIFNGSTYNYTSMLDFDYYLCFYEIYGYDKFFQINFNLNMTEEDLYKKFMTYVNNQAFI